MIYQHATDTRDKALADHLSRMIETAQDSGRSGTPMARHPKKTRKTLRAQLLRQAPELGSN
jgi:hypothetical protein